MFLSKLRLLLYGPISNFIAWKYRFLYKMDIGEGTKISRLAKLDRANNPNGIHIGKNCIITGGVLILAHDACRKMKADTRIGNNCFIGTRSIIMPGISLGDEVIVGAGSVVTKDVPSHCIVAGNPAKIIKENIHYDKHGRLQK